MRLTKRIFVVYTISIIISIIICFGFYIGFKNSAHQGEELRVVEKSEGVKGSLDKLLDKYSSINKILGDFSKYIITTSPDTKTATGRITTLVNHSTPFDFNLLYNSNYFTYNLITPYKTEININTTELNKVIERTLKLKKQTSFIVSLKDEQYIISLSHIDTNAYNYFISIKLIDDVIYDYISSSTQSICNFIYEDELNLKKIYNSTVNTDNYMFNENKKNITTYIPIEILSPEHEKIYLEVTQVKKVITSVITNIIFFSIAILSLLVITNIIVYKVIKASIVNRIVNLNLSVLNADYTSANLRNNSLVKYNDEITDLSNSIDTMYLKLKAANNDIENKVIELKSYSEEMKTLATYDSLTSLYNRRVLHEYTQTLCNKDKPFTLFFLDLDNFKKLNDTIGHEYGDKILVYVSNSLKNLASDSLKVGRLGGDEFIILKEGILNHTEIENIAELILDTISAEYTLKNYKYKVEASIGIASYPKDTNNHTNIYKYADIAMYESKKIPGTSYKIFDCSMNNLILLENKLATAIESNEIQAYYQPIFDLNKNDFTTVEALVRWVSPEGIISPDEFLPIAKQTELIIQIDNKIFDYSCSLCKEFMDKYNKSILVSVNASAKTLMQTNFVNNVLSTIDKYKIPHSCVQLEITEDEVIHDFDKVSTIIKQLRSNNIKIALDDFGVGYSSFEYIKKLPLDSIKLDRSLISSIQYDTKTLSIVKTIIKLGKSLNLKIVCEGVELKSQLDILQKNECDKIQGYYFSKPLNNDETITFINKK